MRNSSKKKILRQIETHIFIFNDCFPMIVPFMRKWDKIWYIQTGHRRQCNKAHVICMSERYRHALRIVIDGQQDATIVICLFIPNQLYMFRAMFSPIIRSTWLYLQLLILKFHLIPDTSRQQYRWTISEAVNTFKYSWWWAKTWPETCRAD